MCSIKMRSDTDLTKHASVSHQHLVFLRHPILAACTGDKWTLDKGHLHNQEREKLLTPAKILTDGFNSIT